MRFAQSAYNAFSVALRRFAFLRDLRVNPSMVPP
jgi:hypothetical protein